MGGGRPQHMGRGSTFTHVIKTIQYCLGSGVTTPDLNKSSGLNPNILYDQYIYNHVVSRRLLSSSTFLQLVTWILLIITKLAIYVISFINFPGLFFVPVLIQFCVTLLVLTFTNVSPSFKASAWHDRLIHCMVCCVLPLAVSDDPQWQLQDVSIAK